MVAKFATNARGAMLLLNVIQVTESISGSVVPLAMFKYIFQQTANLFAFRMYESQLAGNRELLAVSTEQGSEQGSMYEQTTKIS